MVVAARLRIGELLVASKILSEEHLEEALKLPRAPGQRLGELLVSRGLVTETQLTQTLGQQLSVPWVSLYHVDFSRQLLNLVPHELADRYCLVPIFVRRVKRQDTLYVAMADPTNEAALQEVSRSAGLPARPMIGSPTDIQSAIRVYYGAGPDTPERETPRPIPPPPPTNPEGISAKGASTTTARPAGRRPEAPMASRPAVAPPAPAAPSAVPAAAAVPPPPPTKPRPSAAQKTTPENRPGADRAPTERPSTSKAPTERPSGEQASTTRPSAERPAATERPGADHAPTARPSASRPSTEQPLAPRASAAPDAIETSAAERPSTEQPSLDSPDVDPEIEAREIYVSSTWRRPPMVEITLLDGTTLQLPARVTRRRGASIPPAGADVSEGLTARDLIRALRARAEGADARAVLGEDVRWEPLFASLLSLLMRKGLIADWEFIDEFRRVTAARAAKIPPQK